MLAFVNAVFSGKGETVYILEVGSKRRDVHCSCQFSLQPVNLIVHTEREVHVQRRHKVGIDGGIVRLIAMRELCTGNSLEGVIPMVYGLHTKL